MGKNKIVLMIILLFLVLSGLVFGATNITKLQALNNTKTYLQNSDGSIWNASDFMALAVLGDKWNVNLSNAKILIEAKKKFDFTDYPFTASVLKGQNIVPPSSKEINLGSPAIYYRLYTCQDFNQSEFNIFSQSINTWENPYSATHAVFYMDFIKRNYGSQGIACNKPSMVTNATNALTILKNNLLLSQPAIPFPNRFDSYLSQECARGLISNSVPETVMNYMLPTQDKNALEPLTFGGFYHAGKRINDLTQTYDENGLYTGFYYPELPSGHTTMMAACNLLLNMGVGV